MATSSSRYRMRVIDRSSPHEVVGSEIVQFYDSVIKDNQIMIDPGLQYVEHSLCSDDVHRRKHGHYIDGGPLLILKNTYSSERVPMDCTIGVRGQGMYGRLKCDLFPVFVTGNGIDFDFSKDSPPSNFGDRSNLGPQAYNKYRPGRPKIQSSVFIAELRDFPRMIRELKNAVRVYRNLGKSYLASEFGWKPLVRDVSRMLHQYFEVEKTITNIRNNNGKWMHRGGSVQPKSCTSDFWETQRTWCFAPSISGWYYDFGSPRTVGFYRKESQDWFSGAFRYYIPEKIMDAPMWRANTIRKIYGLTITPGDLWEAMPWSWLIDYFTNVGDVLSNLTSGYVESAAKYAYLMSSTTEYAEQQSFLVTQDGKQLSGRVIQERASKRRIAANPFGFGITDDQLSDHQLAILLALGVSRA